jgi:phytoene desaturase
MSDDKYDVLIIGSGVGGLTCASLLAKEGLKVLVLEALDRIGGCCSNYDFDGYKPEVGAIFVIAHFMYNQYFQMVERNLEDYLDFRLIDPVYDIVLEGGERYVLPRDFDAMADVVNSINPADVPNYRRYNADMKKLQDMMMAMGNSKMPALKDFFKPLSLARMGMHKEMLAALPVAARLATHNMDNRIRSYFQDDRLQLIFGWENLYAGLPSHRCNGLFTSMTYMGHDGYYYPKGGMIAIPQAMAKIAGEYGAEIRLNTTVEKIVIENGKAVGVKLAGGEELRSKAVISNAHSRITYLELVGEENIPAWAAKTVRRQPCSIPAPTYYLNAKEKVGIRAHFTVLLNHRRKFDDLWNEFYDTGLLYRPDDGPQLISNPNFDDEDMAPAGADCISSIFIAPPKLKYYDWDDIRMSYTRELAESLERRAFPGLMSKVERMEAATPLDFERTLRVAEGAFFGLEMNGANLGPFRPNYKSMLVDNLYLTGQCTNPGGGVPLVMTSGIITSALLARAWKKI